MTIVIIQSYAMGAWALVVLYFLPSVWRAVRAKATPADVFCTLWAMVGIIQMGFTIRWYVFPHAIDYMIPVEKTAWMALYLTSGMTANMVLFYASYYHRQTPK